jgi:hypothetical protein
LGELDWEHPDEDDLSLSFLRRPSSNAVSTSAVHRRLPVKKPKVVIFR